MRLILINRYINILTLILLPDDMKTAAASRDTDSRGKSVSGYSIPLCIKISISVVIIQSARKTVAI